MRHLMFSWSHETTSPKKWLMSILICSRDDEMESTWVRRGSPRPGDHETYFQLEIREGPSKFAQSLSLFSSFLISVAF